MAIAALYDIHGNLPALRAVLDEIDRLEVDELVIGGDVLPGPMPVQCLELLLSIKIPTRFIYGNGEIAVLNGPPEHLPDSVKHVIRWNALQLAPAHRQLLNDWPMSLKAKTIAFGEILFCHATPRNENEIFTKISVEEDFLPMFADVKEQLVICGHTHMQFDRTMGKTRIVNAGSVGMPFGDPGAYWLLIDEQVEFRHTTYDLEGAAEAILKSDYPLADEFALKNVLNPPSEAAMLETLSQKT